MFRVGTRCEIGNLGGQPQFPRIIAARVAMIHLWKVDEELLADGTAGLFLRLESDSAG
jgi:hypothetical protein